MNSKKPEYDKIIEEYQRAKTGLTSKYVLPFSFVSAVGDISGLRVGDLACGAGNSTRLLIPSHPIKLEGIDISIRQIELANKSSRGLGIRYFVGDLSRPVIAGSNFEGRYDVVTAYFLLNYASSRKRLDNMVRNANLMLDGDPKDERSNRFVGLIPNPNVGIQFKGYGQRHIPKEGIREGVPYTVELSDGEGNPCVRFTNYWWSMKTYRQAFEKNGFDVQFTNAYVSGEGLTKFGSEFWDDYRERPNSLVFDAKKVKDLRRKGR